MDSILRRFGSLSMERKYKITEIEDSICLSPDFILNLGRNNLMSLTTTLENAVQVIDVDLQSADVDVLIESNQEIIDKLSDIVEDLENCVFAVEFFLRGKKTKEAFADYHNLSLSEKIQFRNTQLLIDLLEEKSASLLKASILAAQSKIQLIINKDILKSLKRGS